MGWLRPGHLSPPLPVEGGGGEGGEGGGREGGGGGGEVHGPVDRAYSCMSYIATTDSAHTNTYTHVHIYACMSAHAHTHYGYKT